MLAARHVVRHRTGPIPVQFLGNAGKTEIGRKFVYFQRDAFQLFALGSVFITINCRLGSRANWLVVMQPRERERRIAAYDGAWFGRKLKLTEISSFFRM